MTTITPAVQNILNGLSSQRDARVIRQAIELLPEGGGSVTSDAILAAIPTLVTAWDADPKVAGQVVVDRGGIWQAVDASTNSRPISGNAHWTLIGGTPYVDVLLDPVALSTAPFYDPSQIGNGVLVIPAPGAGKIAALTGLVHQIVSDGDVWLLTAGTQFGYTNTAGSNQINSTGSDGLDGSSGGKLSTLTDVSCQSTSVAPVNAPIVAYTTTDHSAAGSQFGTRSLSLRVFYQILPASFDSYFHITDIDQGTKTITVNGDASALTGTIAVVGSTGNDASYTIVSATFNTDHTDIVVVEAISDATADGWVKQ